MSKQSGTHDAVLPDSTIQARNGPVVADGFSFLQYIHNEKMAHKEHRHKHLLHKLLISGAILGIGQVVESPNLAFFVILLLPPICLVHDIYIFAEHFKVHRIGAFLRSKDTGLPEDSLILKWENYVNEKHRRERFAVWGSLIYTVLVVLAAAAVPWLISVNWTQLHFVVYTASVCVNVLGILFVFVVARLLAERLKDGE